jgi:hypothetical protein
MHSNAIIESIKIPELKQRITKIIANKLGVKLALICNIIEDLEFNLSAFELWVYFEQFSDIQSKFSVPMVVNQIDLY